MNIQAIEQVIATARETAGYHYGRKEDGLGNFWKATADKLQAAITQNKEEVVLSKAETIALLKSAIDHMDNINKLLAKMIGDQ